MAGLKGLDRKSTGESWRHPSGSEENTNLLETPPRLIPENTPEEIFRHFLEVEPHVRVEEHPEYKAIHSYIENYRKSGLTWPEYVVKAKIPLKFREKMARIWAECRKNGFFLPTAGNEKGRDVIMFRQLVAPREEKPKPPGVKWGRCDLCERRCPSKDWRGVMKEGSVRCGTMDDYSTMITD